MLPARRLLVLSGVVSVSFAALYRFNTTGVAYRPIGEIGAASVFGTDPNTKYVAPLSCNQANLNQNPGAVVASNCAGNDGDTCILCSINVSSVDVANAPTAAGFTLSTAISCGNLTIGQCADGVCGNTSTEQGGCSTYLEIWENQPVGN